MTHQQIVAAVSKLRGILSRGWTVLPPCRIDPETVLDYSGTPVEAHQHLLFMCEEIQRLSALGYREKAFRWLGFLQGAVWAFGLTNLEELKAMNAPAPGRGIMDVG